MAPHPENTSPVLLRRALLIVLLVVSLASVTFYAREGEDGPLHAIQAVFEGIVSPFRVVGAGMSAALSGVGTGIGDVTANDATLSALREQNAELTADIAKAEEYRLEAERLRELLDLRDIYDIVGVTARVIGRTTDAWNQTVTIDVGSADGVKAGMTVMGTTGVVGQVVSVSSGSSQVRLLTDPESGVAAVVQSTRAEGIIRGSLTGLLYLENVDPDVSVNVGDIVLTSGLGGSYVKGLIIGIVAEVSGSTGSATRRIIVVPNDTASALEEVMVVFSAESHITSDSD